MSGKKKALVDPQTGEEIESTGLARLIGGLVGGLCMVLGGGIGGRLSSSFSSGPAGAAVIELLVIGGAVLVGSLVGALVGGGVGWLGRVLGGWLVCVLVGWSVGGRVGELVGWLFVPVIVSVILVIMLGSGLKIGWATGFSRWVHDGIARRQHFRRQRR